MKIYPYNSGSASAKALAQALGIKRLKREGKPFKADSVIKWGNATIFRKGGVNKHFFNIPGAVYLATNKLKAFKTLSGHSPIPEFTESLVEASRWLAEGFTVVERHTLTGHSGEGIRIVWEGVELQKAPLYVKYIKKAAEFRVHVAFDKVIHVQQKVARKGEAPKEWKVRNLANGFIFQSEGVELAEAGKEAAITAVKTLQLDFGAVDLIWNKFENKFYVLEVNTAPGLGNQSTLAAYVNAFKDFK
jgi:glutathione synthase/RimK-type ligase-like ATP-grasp enzyme